MTTTSSTLDKSTSNAIVYTNSAFSLPNIVNHSDGTATLQGMKIFRTGTFRDSMGTQRTWEDLHLEDMVHNFDRLKSKGFLPDPPVRDGHPGLFGSGGRKIGFIESLAFKDTFLEGDLRITEPDDLAKIQRGTFRARSLEVGMYESNDEAMYWPVVMGVAFVDIAAVEGLHQNPSGNGPEGPSSKIHFAMTMVDNEKENYMPTAEEQAAAAAAAAKAAADAQAAADAKAAADHAKATADAQAAAAAAAQAAAAAAGNQNVAPAAFQVKGQTTTDHAAVQSHISALEAFQAETIKTGRTDYVKQLAADNKIAAPQIDSLTAIALDLSDEQFTAFRASYDQAPKLGVFGKVAGDTQTMGTPNATQERISVLTEQVSMHRRAGMPEESIEKLDSFKELQRLITSATN